MKTFKLFTIIILSIILIGCSDAGETMQRLNGNEQTLPDELKGLKVYSVSLGDGNWVKVAVLNDNINSSTYTVSKTQETTIVVNKYGYNDKTIVVEEIIAETDDIIVAKKKK